MKPGWEVKKLGEVCEFINGLWTGKKEPYIEVGVIRNTNFTKDCLLDDTDIIQLKVEQKQYTKRKLQLGDIILEKSGGGPKQPVGRVVVFDIEDGEFSFSNFTSAIRIKNESIVDFRFLHRYLYWFYLSGNTENMQSYSTGIRNLKFDEYKQIEIPIPPSAEQRRIVTLLDDAFAALNKPKENAEKNLRNARELFESALESVFANPGEDWEEKKLGEVSIIKSGYSFASGDFSATNQVKTIKITNVGVQEFIEEYDNYLPTEFANVYSKFLVNEGEIVIALTRSVISKGLKVAIVPNTYCNALLNQRVASIKGDNSIILNPFIYSFLCTKKVKDYVMKKANTLMQPNLSINDLYDLGIMFPSIQDQKRIIKKLEGLSSETKKLEAIYQQKLTDLDELKKSILQKAFAGEL